MPNLSWSTMVPDGGGTPVGNVSTGCAPEGVLPWTFAHPHLALLHLPPVTRSCGGPVHGARCGRHASKHCAHKGILMERNILGSLPL